MENEEWREIPGYEGLYEVSNIGRVRSLRPNTRIFDKEHGIMRQKYDSKGYLRVNLHKDGKCKAELISRAVAEAFIPNPNEYPEVGHDDDCKTNNTVENLYWTTRQENLTHNNLHLKIRDLRNENGLKRVIDALSVPIIGTNIDTGEEIYFASMQEASRNGFESGKISMCCSGKRNSHHGYTWRKAKLLRILVTVPNLRRVQYETVKEALVAWICFRGTASWRSASTARKVP